MEDLAVTSKDRFFLSPSAGFVLVDSDDVVWECDLSGYRVTSVPEDAVELIPAVREVKIGDYMGPGLKVEFADEDDE